MILKTATALITPFDDDKSIDYKSLKKLIKFQKDAGVDTIIVLGTTGEAATINDDEREAILDFVTNENAGRAKIVVGTGTNDTMHVVKFNTMAEKYKADGVLIVNPYYNKGTQKSIIEHYKYISERTPLDILLYNVPSRTGMNMLPETVFEIAAQCTNVKGIKEAGGDISQIARLCAGKPDNFDVISGNDDHVIPIMALGGCGVISTFSNVLPAVMTAIVNAMTTKNYEEAADISKRYLAFMNHLFIESNPMPLKYVLSRLGLCRNVLRLPLSGVSASAEKILEEDMKKLNLI
ncbi:MAG: 4-hydroxy-tetrahydrodipicolinate synthase [Bacteroidota bacterium]